MNLKISVIIPVYKVEEYLHQCIDSILSQTYKNIEVILVDDGSPDSSPRICDEYASRDYRVKVIHKPNGGLSDARNVGLDAATGDYIMFVDSDDYWQGPNVLNILCNTLDNYHEKLDFLNFNCIYYYQTDNVMKPWPVFPDIVINSGAPKEIIVGLVSHGMFPMSACMKLIRRDFLIKNDIKFINGIVSEDIPWFLEILSKSRAFRFVNEYVYVYRKQVAGTISSSFSEKKYKDLYNIFITETAKIKDNYSDYELKNALLSFMAYEFCILLGQAHNFSGESRERELNNLKQYLWILKYDLNPKVKLVNIVKSILGLKITSKILYAYITKFVNRN